MHACRRRTRFTFGFSQVCHIVACCARTLSLYLNFVHRSTSSLFLSRGGFWHAFGRNVHRGQQDEISVKSQRAISGVVNLPRSSGTTPVLMKPSATAIGTRTLLCHHAHRNGSTGGRSLVAIRRMARSSYWQYFDTQR
ncbi:hypothetical protein OH76DRAFT_1038016 [Lentinus brumalis]|uniref:Uncharacterized protein n=1 Tax=Lentinus brumalis TaxID=2498619 RepID=A0A371CX77_9APHY|nr:hypothetical protein OH76DRAFT_1038016 [Polyporus brumalis]